MPSGRGKIPHLTQHILYMIDDGAENNTNKYSGRGFAVCDGWQWHDSQNTRHAVQLSIQKTFPQLRTVSDANYPQLRYNSLRQPKRKATH